MYLFFTLLTAVTFLSGCTSTKMPTSATMDQKLDVTYSVIDNKPGDPAAPNKCTLTIRLPKIITEDQIAQISGSLKDNEGSGCSPLFILFFLPDQRVGKEVAWANSSYNPDFDFEINGITVETEATLSASVPDSKSDENVIGVWLDTWAFSNTKTIKKIGDTYHMTTLYGDGSGSTETLTVKVVDGKERLYEDPDNAYGDYMVIEESGNLGFYDNEGFIYEAKKK